MVHPRAKWGAFNQGSWSLFKGKEFSTKSEISCFQCLHLHSSDKILCPSVPRQELPYAAAWGQWPQPYPDFSPLKLIPWEGCDLRKGCCKIFNSAGTKEGSGCMVPKVVVVVAFVVKCQAVSACCFRKHSLYNFVHILHYCFCSFIQNSCFFNTLYLNILIRIEIQKIKMKHRINFNCLGILIH